ncbi:phage tail length tape measure family protein [Luteimonas sp. M1R5S18]|uniref:Phage tail length tape measure family protein n=1 Tax=Luteimonas rhizosphaericola TaxID=3042024 RepID=A0ABT6JGX5_9GAMM|nr:phage tail length tape measure family protein [Luteimonas rhizosphaericola]MDH5829797.1 phage tail length tape measure family protein [Luteimonas rhizosphaericola]
MDIATLSVRVTDDGAKVATGNLEKLAQAGDKAAVATQAQGKAYKQTALSAAQLTAAQRQLPMQFTDIATGLASGQKPLQVLLQQGGQLKDAFGGVGAALRATASYVVGLINPFTLAAGAVGGLVLAFTQMEERQNSIDRALILTGRYSREAADALRDYSRELDGIAGVTAGSAARAIAEVAATGRFTAEQFRTVTTAAETWRVATGTAVEDTVKQFARLQDDPVKAVLELNRTYNFLTESTYDQIRALQAQGRDVDAATKAIEAYANAINTRAPRIAAEVGAISSAFRGLGRIAGETWDQVVEGMDNALDQMIARAGQFGGLPGLLLQSSALGLQRAGGRGGSDRPDFSNVTTGPIVDSARAIADQDWQRSAIRYATEREKLERDIAEARRQGTAAGRSEAEIQARIAAIQADYARRGARSGGRQARGAKLPDFSRKAAEELREMVAATTAARDSFEAMAASLAGPVAEAAYRFSVDQERLNELARKGEIAAGALATAQANLRREYEAEAEAIDRRLNPQREIIAGLEEEVRWLQASAVEQYRLTAARMAGATATDAQVASIADLLQTRDQLMEAEYRWQQFGGTISDSLFDIVTGAESATEALRNLFDNLAAQVTRNISDDWADSITGWLKGASSGGGGGSGGGWVNALWSLFGGGNAGWGWSEGGYTGDGGKREVAGLVHRGEYVIPADATRRLGRGMLDQIANGRMPGYSGPPQVHQVIQVQGLMTRETPTQIARKSAAEMRTATARLG